jgi:CheY-like chemotaxis protein
VESAAPASDGVPEAEFLVVEDGLVDRVAAVAVAAAGRPRLVAVRPLGTEARPSGAAASVSEPVSWARLHAALSADAGDLAAPPRAVPRRVEGTTTRLLLAEDVAVTRSVLVSQLRSLGVEVEAVTDGTEAVEAAGRGDYDVLLLDVQMPGLDGPGAAERIRALAPRRRPWIVALTASATPESLQRCMEAGMDAFYAKPAPLATLRHLVESRPAADADAQPVDWAVLTQIREASSDDLSALQAALATGAKGLLERMRSALRASDEGALAGAARELARQGADVGAARLVSLCERIAAGPAAETAALLLGDVDSELERIAASFRRVARGDAPAA